MMRLLTLVIFSCFNPLYARVHEVHIRLEKIQPQLVEPSNDPCFESSVASGKFISLPSIEATDESSVDLLSANIDVPVEDWISIGTESVITSMATDNDMGVHVDENVSTEMAVMIADAPIATIDNIDVDKFVIYNAETGLPLGQEISYLTGLLLLSTIIVALIYLGDLLSSISRKAQKKRLSREWPSLQSELNLLDLNTIEVRKEKVVAIDKEESKNILLSQSETLDEAKVLTPETKDSSEKTDFKIVAEDCSETSKEDDIVSQKRFLEYPYVMSLHSQIDSLKAFKKKLEESVTVLDKRCSSLTCTNNANITTKNNEINLKQAEIIELKVKVNEMSENIISIQNELKNVKKDGMLSKKNLHKNEIVVEDMNKKIETIETERNNTIEVNKIEVARLKEIIVRLNDEISKTVREKKETQDSLDSERINHSNAIIENKTLLDKIDKLNLENLMLKEMGMAEKEEIKYRKAENIQFVEIIRLLKEEKASSAGERMKVTAEHRIELEKTKVENDQLLKKFKKSEEENIENRKLIEMSELETHRERHREGSLSVRGSFSSVHTDSSSSISLSIKESSPRDSPKNILSNDLDPTGDKFYLSAMTTIKEKLAFDLISADTKLSKDLIVAIKGKKNAESNARLYRNECIDLKKEVFSVKKFLTEYKAEMEVEKSHEDSLRRLNDESARQRSTLIAHMEVHNSTLISQIASRDLQIISLESQILVLNSRIELVTNSGKVAETEIEKLKNVIQLLEKEITKLKQELVRTPGKNVLSNKKSFPAHTILKESFEEDSGIRGTFQCGEEDSNFSPIDLFSKKTIITTPFHPTSSASFSSSSSASYSGSRSGFTSMDKTNSSNSNSHNHHSDSFNHNHNLCLSFDSPGTTIESISSTGKQFAYVPVPLYLHILLYCHILSYSFLFYLTCSFHLILYFHGSKSYFTFTLILNVLIPSILSIILFLFL